MEENAMTVFVGCIESCSGCKKQIITDPIKGKQGQVFCSLGCQKKFTTPVDEEDEEEEDQVYR